MAPPVISTPTAVQSSPLLTIGNEKPDKGVRRGQATKLSTELGGATANQQDTSDSDSDSDHDDLEGEKKLEVQTDKSKSDDEALDGREKEVEVQADTKDKSRPRPRPILIPRPRPQPRLQSPAAPVAAPDAAPNGNKRLVHAGPRPAASTKHGAVSTETKGKDAKKQHKGASDAAPTTADVGSETAAADAGAHVKSRLPFGRNKNGPRKGGKQKEKGALGRAYGKLIMGLFSRKKKEPVEENPYAAPITPYQQARANLAQSPGPAGPGSLPSNPRMNSFGSSTAPPPYQSPSMASDSSRYGDQKFGNQNGYGANRYDNDNASAFNANQGRPGGYGGLGGDDAGNNQLFGGASNRYVPPQQGVNGSPSLQSPPSRYDNDPSKGTLLGNAQDRYNPLPPTSREEGAAEDDQYGGYGAPRELTEEEKEEQEVRNTKDEINRVRQAGIDSTDRSIALSEQAIQAGLASLARMGQQGDRLHKTERNLDEAAAKSRIAEDKTKELNHYNRGLLSIKPSNPFTSKKREEKQLNAVLQRHQMERKVREETQRELYRANDGLEQTFKEFDSGRGPRLLGSQSAAETNKYAFEDDDGEQEMKEQEQSEKLDRLGRNVGQLNKIAHAMNDETTAQNVVLGRLAEKSDAVDDHVRMNREKLSRIH